VAKKNLPPPPATSSHPLAIGIAVLIVIAVAGLLIRGMNSSSAPVPATAASGAQPPTPEPNPPLAAKDTTASVAAMTSSTPPSTPVQAPASTRPGVKKTPAKGPLPPLPMLGFAPPRPIDVVQAAFEFAARRPDVLEYVPCFCGCENSGHRGNDDCFVKSRDSQGKVEWEPHGMS
jgi:Protein of unknown function with PCYCGC motif